MTACLLYAKIHKNKAENLLHLMLYFSNFVQCGKPVDAAGAFVYNGHNNVHTGFAGAAQIHRRPGCRCKRRTQT